MTMSHGLSVFCFKLEYMLRSDVNAEYMANLRGYIEVVRKLMWDARFLIKAVLIDRGTEDLLVNKSFVRWILSALNWGHDWNPTDYGKKYRALILQNFDVYCNLTGFECPRWPGLDDAAEYLSVMLLDDICVPVRNWFGFKVREYIELKLDPMLEREETSERGYHLKEVFDLLGQTVLLGSIDQVLIDEDMFRGSFAELKKDLMSLNIPRVASTDDFRYKFRRFPNDYLKPLLRLAMKYEDNGYDVFLPLSLSVAPICPQAPIDTQILCSQILKTRRPAEGLDERLLWGKMFNVSLRPFNLGSRREFPCVLTTDGYSAKTYAMRDSSERLSIQSQPHDLFLDELMERTCGNKVAFNALERYLKRNSYERIIQHVNIVTQRDVADPDLFLKLQDRRGNVLSYREAQYRVDLKVEKYRFVANTHKEKHGFTANVEQMLNKLAYSFTHFSVFLQYVGRLRETLFHCYGAPLFMELRWKYYRNVIKTEGKFMDLIRHTFGPLETLVLVLADDVYKSNNEVNNAFQLRGLFSSRGVRWLLKDSTYVDPQTYMTVSV